MSQKTETIRTFNGVILGTIETDKQGNSTARKFAGPILGTHEAGTNRSRTFGGPVLGEGKGLLYSLFGK